MNVKTPDGTIYGVDTLEEGQQILAAWEAERDHEGCPECWGTGRMLSLDACIAEARAELAAFGRRRANGTLAGDYTPREIALVARLDAWAAVQPRVSEESDEDAR